MQGVCRSRKTLTARVNTAVSLRRQRNGGIYQMKTSDFPEPSQPVRDNPSSTIFDGPPPPLRRYKTSELPPLEGRCPQHGRKGVNPIPLNSAGNFNRIPPVLAKPKPPPFNKGGFQKNRTDNIRPYGNRDDIHRFTAGRSLPNAKGGFPFSVP